MQSGADSATEAMAIEESSLSRSESDAWDHESEGDDEEIEGEGADTEGEESDPEAEDESAGEEDGSDENTMVPEYERLRQENIKKNRHRLQELGILNLAMSLKSSGRTKKAAGGRGQQPPGQTSEVTAKPRASCEKRGNLPVRYNA